MIARETLAVPLETANDSTPLPQHRFRVTIRQDQGVDCILDPILPQSEARRGVYYFPCALCGLLHIQRGEMIVHFMAHGRSFQNAHTNAMNARPTRLPITTKHDTIEEGIQSELTQADCIQTEPTGQSSC